nr:FAD-dependent oxidoreductase [Candidatus Prometheoarchaeum syntrophicum]QEE16511.1 Sulfide dehydrogenase subunit alpha precursor [Candidatus Prometheoarchaeum syntrophicum]
MKFFKLLEPFKIGELQLRNRTVMPAMHMGAAENGFVTEQLIEFYRIRAASRVGLIIIGGIGVSKLGTGGPTMVSLSDDKYIPGMRKLVDSIHNEGAKVIAQLYHAGGYAFSKLIGEQSVSSSAVYSRFTHEIPHELSIEEIQDVQERIVQAATRAEKAGFDGIEVLSSAGYLIDQFLSPVKNKRTDRYGGQTLEERMTFPLELVHKLKKNVGHKMIIGCRFSGDDFVPGSNTYLEKKKVAIAYEKEGIQFFNVTGGWHETRVPQIPMDTPKGTFTYLAKEIKSVVSAPVFASNRINTPELAENLLQDFYCDAVCFGRSLIADPDFVLKIEQNKIREIRTCIGCNQGCFDNVFKMQFVRCAINPLAGYELKYKTPKKADFQKKVMIIGGGPAGMEAALTATKLGHKVSLYEKDNKLGGQIKVGSVPQGREELNNIIDYYQNQFKILHISYKTGINITPEIILEENPDIIFFATGVHFKIPKIEGIDGSLNCDIHFADEALAGNCLIGKKVVVVGASATGVETALWVAKKGAMNPEVARFLAFYKGLSIENAMKRTFRGDREVYLLEYLPKIGTSIGKSTKWIFLDEIKMLDINVISNIEVTKFAGNTVYFKDRSEINNGQFKNVNSISDVDTFILATGVTSNRDLANSYKKLFLQKSNEKKIPEMKFIGDSRKVGTILDAIKDGFKAALKLGKV